MFKAEKVGMVQWHHFNDYGDVITTINLLHDLGVTRLRTDISWADSFRPNAWNFFDFKINMICEAGIELLVCLCYTPPSISRNKKTTGPPEDKYLGYFSNFVQRVCKRYKGKFSLLQIWNEANDLAYWDRTCDPHWNLFDQMVKPAISEAKDSGMTVVFTGMVPIDPNWIKPRADNGVLDEVDIIAVHGFPGMWWGKDKQSWESRSQWTSWDQKIDSIRPYIGQRPVWITETGLSTCNEHGLPCPQREEEQEIRLRHALEAKVNRMYWYCLMDLDTSRETIEETALGYRELHEYHMGVVDCHGMVKPAFNFLRSL